MPRQALGSLRGRRSKGKGEGEFEREARQRALQEIGELHEFSLSWLLIGTKMTELEVRLDCNKLLFNFV